MQSPSQPQTTLTQTLTQKTTSIHQTLIKIGNPNIPVNLKQWQSQMGIYFQASDSRLELIQYLIGVIYPGYKLDQGYRNVYDEDPHMHRVKKYMVILWQLGVMPVSRYTKNLDYGRYVEGLIGYQSSVNLIYNLTQLAQSKYSSNIPKIYQIATDLLSDLIKNNTQLVNTQYDPYIIFPPKYYTTKNKQQDLPILNQTYQEIQEQLADINIESKILDGKDGIDESEDTNRLLGELDGYRELFGRKYEKLGVVMDGVIGRYGALVGDKDNGKQISELHQRRMLDIPKSLCKKYRAYKKQTQTIKQPQFTTNLKQLKNQLQNLINSLNQLEIQAI